MKYFLGFLFLLILAACNELQSPPSSRPKIISKDTSLIKAEEANPYSPIDVSPMDMSYFPEDYPVLKMSDKVTGLPMARVIYSRPHKQGRKIFGTLLIYGEPWRLGANEATEIEFFQPVKIQNKSIATGKYILYCIPQKDKWTMVLNTNLYSWGLKLDPTKDVYKFDIPIQVKPQSVEYFSMVFQKADGGANLVMAWDNVEAKLPIQYLKK